MTSNLLYPRLKAEEYLDLANELSFRHEPAAIRTAADRAYYAVFLTSRDSLLEKGYIEPYRGLDDHDYISRTLKSREVLGSAGNDENRLRLARNRITYNTSDLYLGKPYGVHPLDWILNTAKDIIKQVKALPKNPKKP